MRLIKHKARPTKITKEQTVMVRRPPRDAPTCPLTGATRVSVHLVLVQDSFGSLTIGQSESLHKFIRFRFSVHLVPLQDPFGLLTGMPNWCRFANFYRYASVYDNNFPSVLALSLSLSLSLLVILAMSSAVPYLFFPPRGQKPPPPASNAVALSPSHHTSSLHCTLKGFRTRFALGNRPLLIWI